MYSKYLVAGIFAFILTAAPAQAQQSPHGPLRFACEECHTTQSWTTLRTPLLFNHDSTAFPLRAQHGSATCGGCHSTLKFNETSTRCIGCHKDIHRAELGALCERCHNPNTWLVPDMAQRHRQTRFPLMGPHLNAPCQSCHVNQQVQEYVGTPVECFSCHRQQYDATAQPAHRQAGFSIDCIQCHVPTSFQWGAGFDHQRTVFPLVGAHQAVPCSQCHTGGVFSGLPLDCFACHQTGFNAVTDPNHVAGNFSHQCLTCHSMIGWRPATFDHNTTMFKLTGAHAILPCASCHGNGVFQGLQTQCVSCHLRQYTTATNPVHTPSAFPQDCQTCHTTTAWQPAGFDHSKTQFPLLGAHATVPCASCHKNGIYVGTSTLCDACHETDFVSTTNPAHVAGGFPRQCEVCHSVTDWQSAHFDHSKTAFPLTGAHASQPCTACHANNVFVGTPTDCYSCHANDFGHATDPPHVAGGFSHICTTCHTTTSWDPAQFDHSTTVFPLTGAHASQPCTACHVNNVFVGTSTDCYTCHTSAFTGTTNPAHVSGGFSHQCIICHTTVGWQPAQFDHSKTLFPLTGAHANQLCTACHINNVFAGTPTDCYACHVSSFAGTSNPPHVSGGFSHQCIICHTTLGWDPALFDHTKTIFPLTGAHVQILCASCHTNGNFTSTSPLCFSCHQQNYNAVLVPAHKSGGLSTDCQRCHTTVVWKPSTFSHDQTLFPLMGAHVGRQCTDCHKAGPFAMTPTACVGCHHIDYNNSVNPPHAQLGYPLDCQRCHSVTVWRPSSFNHNQTQFPLTGIHATTACSSCHKNGAFASTPTVCVICHQTDYNNSVNPPHAQQGYPTTCQQCHSTTGWRPSSFNHNQTQFPLTGIHATTVCSSCHKNGAFASTPTACVSCHQTDYNNSVNPPHAQQGYPTTCQQCHSTSGWNPSTFNHNQTQFPLTGVHAQTPCISCHKNGAFASTSTVCVSCHQADYNTTTNPPHAASLFPTDCQTCHTTSAWIPSTFNHTPYFPIAAGSTHAPGTWSTCADCHTVQTNFLTFSCITCHQHSQASTDNQHQGVSGYVYDSNACYRCHPTGRSG